MKKRFQKNRRARYRPLRHRASLRVRLAKPRVAKGLLTWLAPSDTNRFQADQHQEFINWTKTLK